MALELCRRVFFELPLGNTANAAGSLEPFVPQPAGGTAVSGIGDHEGLVAVRRDPGLIARHLHRLDAVQQPPTRRPELDLVDQAKDLDAFPIVTFSRLLDGLLIGHDARIPICRRLRRILRASRKLQTFGVGLQVFFFSLFLLIFLYATIVLTTAQSG